MNANRSSSSKLKATALPVGLSLILGVMLLAGLTNSEPNRTTGEATLQDFFCGVSDASAAFTNPRTGEKLQPYFDYVPGYLAIILKSDAVEVGEVMHNASGTATTGIAEFDSIGAAFGLKLIGSKTPISPLYKRAFGLHFPEDADLEEIVRVYCQLPYIETVEPNYLAHIDAETPVRPNSWGGVKSDLETEGGTP